MTPEAQRIAIAEACGWQADGPWANYWTHKRGPAGVSIPTESLPDYLNDLNAMHAAEKVLAAMHYQLWICELNEIVGRDIGEQSPYWSRNIASATAAQRAEAFLRTLNLYHPTP
jgi:hypothetical protein